MGDEGRAVADRLGASPKYKIVIRPAGGSNAGHTVIIDGKRFALHHIPAGILHGKTAILGSGMCVNPLALMDEINDLEKAGIPTASLYLSDRASLLMPWHIEEDILQEKARGETKIGTTCKGIGPCYRDHIDRVGLRLVDFAESEERWRAKLKSKLGEVLEKLERLYPSFIPAEFFDRFPFENLEAIVDCSPEVIDLPEFLRASPSRRRHSNRRKGRCSTFVTAYRTSPRRNGHGCLDGMGIGQKCYGCLRRLKTRHPSWRGHFQRMDQIPKPGSKLGQERTTTVVIATVVGLISFSCNLG